MSRPRDIRVRRLVHSFLISKALNGVHETTKDPCIRFLVARARQYSGTTAVSVVVNNTAFPGSFRIPPRISLNPCGSERAFSIHDSAMKFSRAALFALFAMTFLVYARQHVL